MNQNIVIAPVLLPFIAALILLAANRLPISARRPLAILAVLGQIALAFVLVAAVNGGEVLVYRLGNWSAPWGIVLVADRLAALMLLVTALLALFALIHAGEDDDRRGPFFHVLFMLQLFGLSGAFLTGDLFNLFVFFEALLIASSGLLLHGGGEARVRAGLHYVVLNLLGSSVFLIAAGLCYGVLGTLNFADLAVRVALLAPDNVWLVKVAGLLLLGVFLLKAALLPLHLWLPIAYASAPASVAALFAIMTKVGAYAILRVQTLVFGMEAGSLGGLYEPVVLPLAMLTLGIGMIGVLAATRLGVQAGYLVVASVGTLLIAFGLGTGEGIAAGLYYLPHSTFAAGALFLLTDAIARRRPTSGDLLVPDAELPNTPRWGGVYFVLAIMLAGLPPMAGFLGKFLLLQAASSHPAMPWVWSVVLLTALLGLMALARTGSLLFFNTRRDAELLSFDKPAWRERLSIGGLIALVVVLTIWAGPISEYATAAAGQLMHPAGYITAVLGGGR